MNVPANLPSIMTSPNQPPIGATVDHYRILSKLGEGGMGVVYEAEDLTLGRRAALKFCSSGRDDPKVRADLLKEARAASSLSHPNIATVYEFVENPGGDPFIAMELVSGTNLRDVLANRHLSVAETLNIATGVAAALAEAHRHGIIHRDIKPGNIHLTPAGDARVLDFGIARTPAPRTPGTETADAPTRTLEGFIGTPLYMSPEQASGEMLDARSDLFSLGAVIYECLAGKTPFAGDTLTSIMARLLTTDPPPPSRVNPRSPAQLDRIVLKLLAKDRRARYQSADELLADLRARTGRASLLPLRWPSRRVLVTALAGWRSRPESARRLGGGWRSATTTRRRPRFPGIAMASPSCITAVTTAPAKRSSVPSRSTLRTPWRTPTWPRPGTSSTTWNAPKTNC